MPSWLSIALREPLWLSKTDPHRGGSISLQPRPQHAAAERPGSTAPRDFGWGWTCVSGSSRVVPQRCPEGKTSGRAGEGGEEHHRHLTAACPIRHGGFVPQLSDVEVITMIICGEFFKLSRDMDLFAYFRAHYRSYFPALTDRTLFVRQAANLWQLQAAMQRRRVQVSR